MAHNEPTSVERIGAYSWSVVEEYTDEAQAARPVEDRDMVRKLLMVDELLVTPIPLPDGSGPLLLAQRRIVIPLEVAFPGATPMWVRLSRSLAGEELPPDVQVAPASMLGHLAKQRPNGSRP